MHWIRIGLKAGDEVLDDEMVEVRAMVVEKDNALVDICGRAGIVLPDAVAGGDLHDLLIQYQDRFITLFDSTPKDNYFADTEANDFLTFISGADAAGYKNPFRRAGLGADQFLLGVPDPAETLHLNRFRLVGDLFTRLKLPAGTMSVTESIAGTGAQDNNWAIARAAGFAAQTGVGSSDFTTFVPYLGRHADSDVFLGEPPYAVSAVTSTKIGRTVDTSGLAGYTILRAWVAVSHKNVFVAGGQHDGSPFDFHIDVGGVNVRDLASDTAADITDHSFANHGLADAWKASVDPDLINPGGNTEVEVVFDEVPTDDDAGWNPGTAYYQCWQDDGGSDPAALCQLIVELALDFRVGEFKRGEFKAEDFLT